MSSSHPFYLFSSFSFMAHHLLFFLDWFFPVLCFSQTLHKLYLILDYIPGGELFSRSVFVPLYVQSDCLSVTPFCRSNVPGREKRGEQGPFAQSCVQNRKSRGSIFNCLVCEVCLFFCLLFAGLVGGCWLLSEFES